MQDYLFYGFALATLVCAFLVVANPFSRSPVTSAMFLVLTIVGLASLFVLLHAFFLAAIQVLVYAGAVMVLFLFVIMLLDLKDEEKQKFRSFSVISGLLGAGALLFIFARTLLKDSPAGLKIPGLEGGTADLGRLLFTDYLLPFEIVSVLLLVAMVGVVLLSKRDLK
jgi:NADH-quinone oxidoreductase subunit J